MKLLPLLLLLTCLTLGIASCNLLGGNEDPSSMTAMVNGEEWESNPLVATYAKVDTSLLTLLTLTGNTGGLSASTIILQVVNYEGEGTYDLSAGQSVAFANYLPDFTSMEVYSSIADNSTGTLTISDDNDEFAEGTFSFTAALEKDGVFESIEVTDGAFKINKL